MPCFNTVTRLPAKTDSHQPRSCLAILSRTHSPHTAVPLHQRAPKKQNNKALRHWNNQKYSTTYMPAHYLTYALSTDKTRDVYGTVVAIGPHRRYYIKTHSGRVLVRNRRFLRRRIPASLQPLVPQGRSYIQAIEAYASLNKLKSKPSTQIMVLM